MLRIVPRLSTVTIFVALCFAALAFAQAQQQAAPRPAGPAAQAAKDSCWGRSPCSEDHRPLLAFREDWMDATPGVPTDYKDKDLDAHLQNKNLTHGRYGTGAKDVIYDRHIAPRDDPGYIWLGACAAGPCVITLKDKNDYLDLSNPMSKVVWRTKQGGFRQLRLVLKLADGSFLVSDRYAGPAEDWNISEILIGDVHWRILKIQDPRMYEDALVEKPDLTRVDEIGFSDLMLGGPGFTSGTSRVDWIEVYANRVKRPAGITNNGN